MIISWIACDRDSILNSWDVLSYPPHHWCCCTFCPNHTNKLVMSKFTSHLNSKFLTSSLRSGGPAPLRQARDSSTSRLLPTVSPRGDWDILIIGIQQTEKKYNNLHVWNDRRRLHAKSPRCLNRKSWIQSLSSVKFYIVDVKIHIVLETKSIWGDFLDF